MSRCLKARISLFRDTFHLVHLIDEDVAILGFYFERLPRHLLNNLSLHKTAILQIDRLNRRLSHQTTS